MYGDIHQNAVSYIYPFQISRMEVRRPFVQISLDVRTSGRLFVPIRLPLKGPVGYVFAVEHFFEGYFADLGVCGVDSFA